MNKHDQSRYLIHLTRKNTDKFSPALHILSDIVYSGKLLGSEKYIKGKHVCICFSESSLYDLSVFIKNYNKFICKGDPRYELYGVAVNKKELYSIGARPVIYQPESDYDKLPDNLKYKHATLDLNNKIDFSWEREWRLNKDCLNLHNLQKLPIVLVHKVDEIFTMQEMHFQNENCLVNSSSEASRHLISGFLLATAKADLK